MRSTRQNGGTVACYNGSLQGKNIQGGKKAVTPEVATFILSDPIL